MPVFRQPSASACQEAVTRKSHNSSPGFAKRTLQRCGKGLQLLGGMERGSYPSLSSNGTWSRKPLQVRVATIVAGCLLAVTPAWADGPQEPWPEALRHRNARYAQLQRSTDPQGEARERRLADFMLARSTDPLGDREERRRARASRHDPPRATAYAEIARADDVPGDQHEAVLATLPRARIHAELRRFRDLNGDMEEFARWQIDRVRGGPLRWSRTSDGAIVADERENTARKRFVEERLRDREDDAEERAARRDRDDDRELERSMGFLDDRHERQLDREVDREVESAEAEAEAALEDAERDLEKEEDRLDADLDRELDKIEAGSERELERDETHLERQEERDVERQIQQEEENTLEDE